MIFAEYKKLSIIALNDESESISFGMLASVLQERPSTVIYCELEGRLYGCISVSDISRARKANSKEVKINKRFIYVNGQGSMYARKIFYEQSNINWIPVIDNNRKLLGEYKRFDDVVAFPYLLTHCSGYYAENSAFMSHVALVRPSAVFNEKHRCMKQFERFLKRLNINVDIIVPKKILDYWDRVDWVLFTDKEELLAIGTFLQDVLGVTFHWAKARTYQELIKEKYDIRNTQIGAVMLENLQKAGVNVLTIQTVKTESVYFDKLDQEIKRRFAAVGHEVETKLHECYYKDFFAELFSDEYVYEILHSEFELDYTKGIGIIKNKKSRYCNAQNGERKTVGQPDNFSQCIYFYGPCITNGWLVEDKHTMESFLQQKINKAGYPVKVYNLGYLGTEFGELNGILQTPLREGDIVVIYINNGKFSNIPNLNLASVLEEHQVSAKWIIDDPVHVNHKVYELYANAVYNELEEMLCKKNQKRQRLIKQENQMVKHYIQNYFADYDPSQYEKIGSIVMNCNPFTNGHRYLIEEALKKVDLLIIFVVEENKSVFTFNERFAMVCEGVSDMENVMVVPSGQFIISETTFPEYFIKELNESTIYSAEYDINLFADWIAPSLHIMFRFVGEELNDPVTYQYNEAMKRIFPLKGIQLFEIPRKKQGDEFISAHNVRKYMEQDNNTLIDGMLPISTRRLVCKQIE